MSDPNEKQGGQFRVSISRTPPGVVADCEDCNAYWDETGTSASDNARASAKRHVAMTGHTVHVERSVGTYIRADRNAGREAGGGVE